MRRSKTLWPNQEKLSRKIRRAQANLYLSRFGLDTVSQETTDTINDHRYIIERDQFSSSTIFNTITESAPQTPPYSGYSSEDSDSQISHSNMPERDEDDDNREEEEYEAPNNGVDDQADLENLPKEPLRGFSGNFLAEESTRVNALHISNSKKIYITDDTELSWESLKKFRAQCKQTDVTVEIKHVVSKLAFRLIINCAVSAVTDVTEDDIKRLQDLENLKEFTQQGDDGEIRLDPYWNTNTFCKLLEETFPIDGAPSSHGVDDFYNKVKKITPDYDFDDLKVEINTIRAISILRINYGIDRITLKDEELAVIAWIKMWPKATQDNFRAFVGSDSLHLIDEFTMKLQRWSSRGRASGAAAVLAGYAVSPTKLTSFRGKSDVNLPIKPAGKRDFSPPSGSGSSGSGFRTDLRKRSNCRKIPRNIPLRLIRFLRWISVTIVEGIILGFVPSWTTTLMLTETLILLLLTAPRGRSILNL